jgi:hypothetical protein
VICDGTSKNARRQQLIDDFKEKIELFESMPFEVKLAPVNCLDLIGLMKDLMGILEAME